LTTLIGEKNDKKDSARTSLRVGRQMNGLSPEPERKGNCHEVHALVQMGL
jgi:hypothetical protein